MRKSTSEWTVRMLTDLRDRINTEAEYQRGSVWSEAQQRLLIDSLLRGYDLPKVYLRKLPEGGPRLYDVVDGKQRLTAIWRFVGDEFRLARDVVIDGIGNVGRKTWSQLPASAQDRLQFAKVTVSELEDATVEEVAELFLRLQRGEPLRAAEKRNAILGPVRDFVANELAAHGVFAYIGIPNRRFTWHELGAIALLLSLKNGPSALKGADLNDLYEDASFDPRGAAAQATLERLDALKAVAAASPQTITTRWGFVDLFLCVMRLREERRKIEPATVMEFYRAFESERKEASSRLAELQSEVSEWDLNQIQDQRAIVELPDLKPDMFTYVQAFSREGATEENVRVRSEVMFRRLSVYADVIA